MIPNLFILKDRHINNAIDTELMKTVYQEVETRLRINPARTSLLLILKFIFYAGIHVFFYALLLQTGNMAVFLSAYILTGITAILIGFNFAHDLSHNTVFKRKRLNHTGFVLLYTIVGAHAEAWKHRHIHSHHYAPNVKDFDSDLQITHLIRVEPSSPWKWFHRYQHWYALPAYMTYSLYWVFIKDFVIYFSDRSFTPQKHFGYHLSFWMQKAVYLGYMLAVPFLFSSQAWYIVLAGFFLMHAVQSLFLLITFFMTHHVESTQYYTANEEGYIPASWFINQVKSSNDFYPFSKTANFIFGGFNNHIAHHLFPHIHHIHYPQLNRILYPVLRRHSIEPNVTGFISGAYSHLRYLKKMSRENAWS